MRNTKSQFRYFEATTHRPICTYIVDGHLIVDAKLRLSNDELLFGISENHSLGKVKPSVYKINTISLLIIA